MHINYGRGQGSSWGRFHGNNRGQPDDEWYKNRVEMDLDAAKKVQIKKEKMANYEQRTKGADKAAKLYFSLKKYPGISQDSRSSFEKEANIPLIKKPERDAEVRKCDGIFEINRKEAFQTPEILYEKYQKEISAADFTNLEEFKDFIRSRSHVFNYANFFKTVENRGFGYRRGAVYLACLVLSNSSENGIKLSKIFEKAKGLPTYELSEPYFDQFFWDEELTMDELVNYFKRHRRHYHIEIDPVPENCVVKLTEEAMTIPSLWDSTLLTLFHSLPPGESYWDQSRVFEANGTITATSNDYLKVEIRYGLYKDRCVYVYGPHINNENRGLTGKELSKIYFLGDELTVLVHPSFNVACEFRAIKICDSEAKKARKKDFTFYKQKDRKIDLKEEEARFARENKIINELKNLLEEWYQDEEEEEEDNMVDRIEVLFTHLQPNNYLKDKFKNVNELASWMEKRPYVFDMNSPNFLRDEGKDLIWKFMLYMDSNKNGVDTNHLRDNLQSLENHPELQEIAEDEDDYNTFISIVKPILVLNYRGTDEKGRGQFAYTLDGVFNNDNGNNNKSCFLLK